MGPSDPIAVVALSLCEALVVPRVTLNKITSCLHFSISPSSVESWTLFFLMGLVMTSEYGGYLLLFKR